MAGEPADKPRKAQIGFGGGQVLSVRLTPDQLAALRRAVDEAGGWHETETADGTIAVDSREVVFLAVEEGDHRIGFGG